jgi:NAD(P)H-hydrate epimerase
MPLAGIVPISKQRFFNEFTRFIKTESGKISPPQASSAGRSLPHGGQRTTAAPGAIIVRRARGNDVATDAYRNALLTVAEMARADAAAVAGGTPGEALMEAAGTAVASEIRRRWSPRPVVVLCGPGNNGGDGFVVARLLRQAGWDVRVALLGDRGELKGDAAGNAARWDGEVGKLSPQVLVGCALVVDGLFGAGLQRPLDGAARATVEAVTEAKIACVAIDIPSGVHGDTGAVLGAAPLAALTVTFFRRKPGHLLLPGKAMCGETVVADLGIPDAVLDAIAPLAFANGPELWLDTYPWPRAEDHKYGRGHAVVAGGAEMTGAARLAARAAQRIGAGLVTVASPPSALSIYAAALAGVLVRPVSNAQEFAALLADERKNAVLIGPGAGVNRVTRDVALATLAAKRRTVLDADAVSVFAGDAESLFGATAAAPCVLTPHEGEFQRVFGDDGDKLSRTRDAARRCGAVVLLKGNDTVIAAPDGRAAINHNAPPTLATGGTGDVLAGFVLGLLAQGMAPFEAACAAAWLHGEAATSFGPGLIAEDLPETLPQVLRRLAARAGRR